MRTVLRNRYYCDFCKKAGGSGGHIAKHERSCTANPSRVCRMCLTFGNTQTPLSELMAALSVADPKARALEAASGGCPACMLAAMRQSGMQYPPDEDGPGFAFDWNFKAALQAHWDSVNINNEGQERY